MREILFRGKRLDNDLWELGDLSHDYCKVGDTCISKCGGFVQVYPSTVGQYTGLIDKNGAKIFEGDILLIGRSSDPTLIEFVGFSWACTSKAIGPYYLHRLEENSQKYEIIGNIYDNQELLEEVQHERNIKGYQG